MAGELTEGEYRAKLAAPSFTAVQLKATCVCDVEDMGAFSTARLNIDGFVRLVKGEIPSAFVRVRKPESYCEPTCCA